MCLDLSWLMHKSGDGHLLTDQPLRVLKPERRNTLRVAYNVNKLVVKKSQHLYMCGFLFRFRSWIWTIGTIINWAPIKFQDETDGVFE